MNYSRQSSQSSGDHDLDRGVRLLNIRSGMLKLALLGRVTFNSKIDADTLEFDLCLRCTFSCAVTSLYMHVPQPQCIENDGCRAHTHGDGRDYR